ncbi:hypothetical protein L1285_23165 [Pseudoalteromonas sp. DL2-H2.2]|uniref:hypothetical protein n=1 Tax=Pseudoalteromonas sp. DL2-H2.2 TaxID=2908889 RepID=UPI001F1E1CFB|nr:hypothetical protein [Pseudoalteromonas sp. DL2-H2.2]MCF2911204.1 hypothetical protein [Pseudoalteromonas sp. DL2-H2.2]
MSTFLKSSMLGAVFFVSGCASMIGFTGADAGKRVGNWMEYNVNHPGLTIKIMEPYSEELMPISTVGKTSPSPLRHTVIFGTQSSQHKLEIVGRYSKELYLDNKFYGSVWLGDVLISDGNLSIDGKLVAAIEN